jgi:murein DD-endopeptidase MepM/ murein hydrolase activator NlpD
MGEITTGRRGVAAAASLVIMAGLLAACADSSGGPAPVYMRGAAPTASVPPVPPWHENKIITVQRGQSLGAIAHAYHVTEGAIIAANQLKPPYELRAGARLVIPEHAPPAPQQMAVATLPPAVPRAAPPTAVPPEGSPALHPSAAVPPTTIVAAAAPSGAPAQPSAPQPPAPPPSTQRGEPEIIPLDPAPKQVGAAPTPEPAPAAAQAAAASGAPPPGEAQPGGRFPWPVNGRVLASYGAAAGGGHNDGINIAAPRGTAVRTIDGGTVAYAGNEVKGYGNLVLVKHPNGWISAYAHLDDVLVKKGDTVSAGQVIAKVGDSGGVGEPQLHFELRRGQKPVDPREFLAPAPRASQVGNRAG